MNLTKWINEAEKLNFFHSRIKKLIQV